LRRALLDKAEAAAVLDRSLAYLDQDRRDPQTIPFVGISRPGAQRKTIKYDLRDLEEYIEARRKRPPRAAELQPQSQALYAIRAERFINWTWRVAPTATAGVITGL
jgi:hypothetical protein